MGNIVYTGGTFDLLHVGHLELLRACSRMAGRDGLVVVALNTDKFIRDFKGRHPVIPYSDRAEMLLNTQWVNRVYENVGGPDSKATIDYVAEQVKGQIDIVAIGTDWCGRDYYAQMGFTKEWLDEQGIVLVYVDRRTGESSSSIRERISE